MNENNKRETIIVPALQINKMVEPLVKDIYNLTSEAEKINIFVPALIKLSELYRIKNSIRSDYEKYVQHCFEVLSEPVNNAPGSATGYLQNWSTSMGLTATLKLQDAWRNLDSALDRKGAYTLAVLAIYISTVSLFVSVYTASY